MTRSCFILSLLTLLVISALLLPACSRRLPTAPATDVAMNLLLRFPATSRESSAGALRPAVGGAALTRSSAARAQYLDMVSVSVFGRSGVKDSVLVASAALVLAPGQYEFAIDLRVPFLDSYGVRVEVGGTRQRPGWDNPTLSGLQYLGHSVTDPAALQAGSLTVEMRDVVPLPGLDRSSSSDTLAWNAVEWACQYEIGVESRIIRQTNALACHFDSLGTGYRVRARLACGPDTLLGAFSEALNREPPPIFTRLVPEALDAGSGNSTLAVSGSNFRDGAAVEWNGRDLQTTWSRPDLLTASVPAALTAQPGELTVQVRNPDGQRSVGMLFRVRGLAPVLVRIWPNVVVADGTNQRLGLAGSRFQDGAVLEWKGQDLAPDFLRPDSLSVEVSGGRIVAPDSLILRVRNPDGLRSNGMPVTVRGPAPVLDGVRPEALVTYGTDTTFTVVGSNFQFDAKVVWNTTDLVTTFGSSGELVATVPAGLLGPQGPVSITVRNPDKQTSAERTLTVQHGAPLITSIKPSWILAGGADTTLTVVGRGFASNALVSWKDSLDLTIVSRRPPDTLAVQLPHELTASPTQAFVRVRNPEDALSSGDGSVTVYGAGPQLTALIPDQVDARSQTADLWVTIVGSGLQEHAQVWVRNSDNQMVRCSTVYELPTRLRALVPMAYLVCSGYLDLQVTNDEYIYVGSLGLVVSDVGPFVSMLSPETADGSGDPFTLTVIGCDFWDGVQVVWEDGTPLVTTYVSPNELTAEVTTEALYSSCGPTRVYVGSDYGWIDFPLCGAGAPPARIALARPNELTRLGFRPWDLRRSNGRAVSGTGHPVPVGGSTER
jgi:hypothetical protein